jgi:hypothetical protein
VLRLPLPPRALLTLLLKEEEEEEPRWGRGRLRRAQQQQ